jgi:hypothetical protein
VLAGRETQVSEGTAEKLRQAGYVAGFDPSADRIEAARMEAEEAERLRAAAAQITQRRSYRLALWLWKHARGTR